MAPATRGKKRKSDQIQAVDDHTDEASQGAADSYSETSLPVRAKDGEPTPTKGKLVVFGDDDEAAAPKSSPSKKTAIEKVTGAQGEEEDSDDDEAPEAVSTSKAALDIKKAVHAAQKAAKEQLAAQKRKRQQRDVLFKLQAEERKKAEEEAKAAAAKSKTNEDDNDDDAKPAESATGRRRTDRLPIPALLPAELLTDSSDESEGEDATGGARPKRRRVAAVENKLARSNRDPQDERVGSTVYRVTKKVDDRLAPKSKKYSQNSKEALLKRNRTAVKAKSGFTKRK